MRGEPVAYHPEGIHYIPTEARFDYVLPEAERIGAKFNAATRDVESQNPLGPCLT